MATLGCRLDPPRLELDPVADHHLRLESGWWPGSDDPGAALCVLLPVLDQVRGPVSRLLFSAAAWTTRPHEVVLAGRMVSLGYRSDQPPSMITVRCVDGGVFVMQVTPCGPGERDA